MKCFSAGEGSSCFPVYTGTKCNCIDTDYWNGLTCVPKLLDHVITNLTCECRHDLGLESRNYNSIFTCYNNYSPSKTCACENLKFWGGEKCVDKKIQKDYCTTDCQCREDKKLKCQKFDLYDRYSCATNYNGKKCQCQLSTDFWSGLTNGCSKNFNILINKFYF